MSPTETERARILEYAPGPVLDHEIHRRVFGQSAETPTETVPSYSTDLAEAWSVVEELAQSYRLVSGLPVATWFMGHFESMHLWTYTAPEAALAICRIALLALEGHPVRRR